MDIGHPKIDYGIVLVFALTIFSLSSGLPGMSQALSIGDSWKSDVGKMTLELDITGIRPGDKGLIRLCVEEEFLVKELVWILVARDRCMGASHDASIFCRSHVESK
jgi:hypothetical protein